MGFCIDKKKIIITALTAVLFIVVFGAGVAVGAGTAEPGTQGDPIVTLSYLESRLSELKESGGAASGSITGTASGGGFGRVTLTKGMSLILEDGSEMVVYSGNGTVLGTSGLMSLTGSEMFPAGTSVVLYTDFMGIGGNSGVKATGNMTVYVRGGYKTE